MIGNDRNSIVETHDLDHALDRLGLRIVNACELAANHGARRDGCDFHTRHCCVDAEFGCTVDLVGRICPLRGGPNQFEIFRIFERNVRRHRPFRGLVD